MLFVKKKKKKKHLQIHINNHTQYFILTKYTNNKHTQKQKIKNTHTHTHTKKLSKVQSILGGLHPQRRNQKYRTPWCLSWLSKLSISKWKARPGMRILGGLHPQRNENFDKAISMLLSWRLDSLIRYRTFFAFNCMVEDWIP
jgi:hypothetical protein